MDFLTDPALLMAVQTFSNLLFLLSASIVTARVVKQEIRKIHIDLVMGGEHLEID